MQGCPLVIALLQPQQGDPRQEPDGTAPCTQREGTGGHPPASPLLPG